MHMQPAILVWQEAFVVAISHLIEYQRGPWIRRPAGSACNALLFLSTILLDGSAFPFYSSLFFTVVPGPILVSAG